MASNAKTIKGKGAAKMAAKIERHKAQNAANKAAGEVYHSYYRKGL
jgi:hypothetical protein